MGDAVAVDPFMWRERQPRLAELAGRQHGVVSRAQLLALGFSARAVDRMVARGQLHVLHRGVYAVGHRVLSRRARFLAATLAVDGVLSHRSAGVLHAIHRSDGPIELTVPPKRRSPPGLRLHCARLPADETTTVDGIPVTTTPRTLLDLAAVLPPGRLARAVNEAEILRLTDALSVPDLLARYPRRPGTPALRALLREPAAVLRSELEHRYRSFADRFGLPHGSANASRSGHELDVVYERQRVIVELDGRAVHATRQAFEADRERDRKLQAQGWRVVRVTWRQLTETPREVAEDLRSLLGLPSMSG